jgi:hypothetical protein
MLNLNKFLIIILILGILGFNFGFAELKPPSIPQDPNAPIKSFDDITGLLRKIFEYFAIIFWLFAIGAIFYSGYLFIFEGSSDEKTSKAKKMLKYAIIAIVIGLMAYGLPQLILNILKSRAPQYQTLPTSSV